MREEEFDNPKNKKQKRMFVKPRCEECGKLLNKREQRNGLCWDCLRDMRDYE